MRALVSKKIIQEKLSELIKLRDAQVISEVMQAKKEAERIRRLGESHERDMIPVFKQNNIDISAFNALEEKRATIAVKETEQVRETLINSVPDITSRYRLIDADTADENAPPSLF